MIAMLDLWRHRLLLEDSCSSTASDGSFKCVTCEGWTTKAPAFRGNTPRCLDCREGAGYGNERDEDIFDDLDNYYSHYGYGSDSSW
jgi:hypothetical protein